jgi:hypothetical protein
LQEPIKTTVTEKESYPLYYLGNEYIYWTIGSDYLPMQLEATNNKWNNAKRAETAICIQHALKINYATR